MKNEKITITNKNILLTTIVRHLIINYPFIKDISLMNGKMGGVLFFAQYAKYKEEDCFNKIANSLFEEVRASLTIDTPGNLATP